MKYKISVKHINFGVNYFILIPTSHRPQHEIYIGNYPVRFRENDVRKLFEEHEVEVSTIRLKHDGLKV